ncbi:threonine/serine exporter family protein [Levilactobacillus suantsaii]|uniref:Threonine/serine exporter n=1 Tax=Levilactobacillus suantsaii TaxID=2292255 RepID=A0A4Q0VKC1_9LACO|nr:threonine/serine exporter family protein [Levilactobacillus suantsaii]QMU08025.1 threonine/serine exporter family protein [Levilactobacillus suantsaii]RXI79903.1 threonine/serine exporter [Levilactobacillus suantsaii]
MSILELGIEVAGTYVATIAFGILLNIPRRALNLGGWVGVIGFLLYRGIVLVGGGYVVGNLLGAVWIGLASLQVARWKHMPMILFNIPALVPLVPGGQAYQMIKYFALGQNSTAFTYLLQVVMISGSIAFGFLLSEMVNRLRQRGLRRHR